MQRIGTLLTEQPVSPHSHRNGGTFNRDADIRKIELLQQGGVTQCDHVNHVSTQLPYAVSCAVVSGVTYLIAGVLVTAGAPGIIALPIGIALMIAFLFVAKSGKANIA